MRHGFARRAKARPAARRGRSRALLLAALLLLVGCGRPSARAPAARRVEPRVRAVLEGARRACAPGAAAAESVPLLLVADAARRARRARPRSARRERRCRAPEAVDVGGRAVRAGRAARRRVHPPARRARRGGPAPREAARRLAQGRSIRSALLVFAPRSRPENERSHHAGFRRPPPSSPSQRADRQAPAAPRPPRSRGPSRSAGAVLDRRSCRTRTGRSRRCCRRRGRASLVSGPQLPAMRRSPLPRLRGGHRGCVGSA